MKEKRRLHLIAGVYEQVTAAKRLQERVIRRFTRVSCYVIDTDGVNRR